MAKEAVNSIRFACAKCKAALRVPGKYAGRYIDCPRCKQRTEVPSNQAEADEFAQAYNIKQIHTDVGEKCLHCGARLRKGAVLCTKCGFDYREGKRAEFRDLTRRVGEDVTYEKIFKAPFEKEVGNITSNLLTTMMAINGMAFTVWIAYFLAAMFLFALIEERMAAIITIATYGIIVVCITFVEGSLWFTTMVETCSKFALGLVTGTGGLIRAGLLHYAIRAISLAPILFALVVYFSKFGWKLEDFRPTGPIAALLVVGLIWNVIYVTMAVASFAVEATLNPLMVAYWFGRSFLDLLVLMGYFTVFVAIFWGLPIGIFGYMIYQFLEDTLMRSILAVFLGVILQAVWAFTSVSIYACLGLVLRKNSEW